jgi:uncharacterized cupin superfamily protein
MISDKVVMKAWGFELTLVNNDLYCGKLILSFRGRWSTAGAFHYHRLKDETFVVLIGALALEVEGCLPNRLKSLDSFRIKPGVKHRFAAATPFCLFLEVSTRDDEEDNIRCRSEG